jgi:HlyD family secretion protein
MSTARFHAGGADFRGSRRVEVVLARVTLALTVALAAGCSKPEPEKEPVFAVRVEPADKATVSEVVTAEAVVFPLEQATIAPKITAQITELPVQRGSHVKKGQILAKLENRDLVGQAESSEGDYKSADAAYALTVNAGLPQQIQKAELDAAAAKAAFDAAQKVYESRKELFQQGAIPRRDLDTAEVNLAQARSQSEQAQKQLADLQRLGRNEQLKAAQGTQLSAKGKYDAAAAQLSYSEIRSPIDGVVTERPLYRGDLAVANQPLLTVMNLSRLIAKAHIPQSEAAKLKEGNTAQIKVPGLDQAVPARVSLVSPALDPGSTTVEVWVEARKPDAALRPGVSVELTMAAKTVKDAIAVPAAAVFKNSQGAEYVLVAGSDEKAHQRIVQLGVKGKELVQVASGIKEGDAVVTEGGYGVPDGAAIKVEKPGEEDKEGDAKEGDQADKKGASDDKTKDQSDVPSMGGGPAAKKSAGAAKTPAKGKE